ncbi:MAG: DUF4401 domain-containing protein [Zoogloeaceae bacterium]|jgi:hypothetical protein|nr:DUF4401 domain-containing protein [Zoogloeaceae bacterium]
MNQKTSALPRLLEHGILSAETLQDLETHSLHTPGWLAALQGIAAWIAASMLILAFTALFARDFSQMSLGICGVLLLGVTLFLFYRKDDAFFVQLALAFSLAGQAMLTIALGEGNGLFYPIGALIAVAMTLPRSTLPHRSLCSLVALVYLTMWVFSLSNDDLDMLLIRGIPRLEMLALLFAAMSVALWLSREVWVTHKQAMRCKALAHAGMLMNFGVMGYFCVLQSFSDYAQERLEHTVSLPIYSWGAAFLFLSTCFWLSRKLPLAERAVLGVAALVIACAAFNAPWLPVCASLSLAAFYACHRGWFILSLVVAVWFLGQFYYNLELTLLVKSGVLALSGGVLLALCVILRHWQRKPA